MDEIAFEFSETRHKMAVQSCDDIHELRQIAAALVQCHYAQKRLLHHYMLEGLPDLSHKLKASGSN